MEARFRLEGSRVEGKFNDQMVSCVEKLSCERNNTGGDAFWKQVSGLAESCGLSQRIVSSLTVKLPQASL